MIGQILLSCQCVAGMVRFDHALIFVEDLRAAVRSYSALGFSVVSGGAHDGDPTENALIPLGDGSYLELIAFRRRSTLVLLKLLARLGLVTRVTRNPLSRRFAVRAAGGPGLIDLVVWVPGLGPAMTAARRAGCLVHGPVSGRRTTPDGQPIAWELGVPDDDELPLLIADTTPRPLRTGSPAAARHPNGASGVTDVVLPVRDAAVAETRFRDLLGVPGQVEGGRAIMTIGTTRLVLEPNGNASSNRPISLRLGGQMPARLDPKATHGAVLELG
jgi:catechol 2,3-dioxygenase-like lactoylglutathione lyase family enzyme